MDFEFKQDTIYNMDCLEGMKLMPDKCVDVSFTSPPYNDKGQSDSVSDTGKFKAHTDHHAKYKWNDFREDWYQWQCDYINDLDLTALTDAPLYTETVQLRLVHPCKNKDLLKKEATLCLYGDRITIDGESYPFDELSAITLLGKNKLNVYAGSDILQLKGSKRFNGLKYVNFIHRWKNIRKGEPYDQFLGL
jgi:hypothetical protein